MDPKQKAAKNGTALFLVAGLFILFALGLPCLTIFVKKPAPDPMPPPIVAPSYEPYRANLEGKLICLPHAPGYPPTEECAEGLQATDGKNYVIDFMLLSAIPAEHRIGDHVSGAGVVTPIERLNTDHWRRYDVKGIFSVTDSFKVIGP